MGKRAEVVESEVEETIPQEKPEKRVAKAVKKDKVHLTPEQVVARITELEGQLKALTNQQDLPAKKKTRKRKLIFRELVRMKRAQHKPEEFLKDPEVARKKRELKKQKRIERIRKKRAEEREANKMPKWLRSVRCLSCRKKGHSAKECRQGLAKETLCYFCGSKDHNLSNCPNQVKKGAKLPYATCFTCGEQGHITSQCRQNRNGVYPLGGKCFRCGSRRHLAVDCPKSKKR